MANRHSQSMEASRMPRNPAAAVGGDEISCYRPIPARAGAGAAQASGAQAPVGGFVLSLDLANALMRNNVPADAAN
jgi:hypothetical protein